MPNCKTIPNAINFWLGVWIFRKKHLLLPFSEIIMLVSPSSELVSIGLESPLAVEIVSDLVHLWSSP